MAVKEVATTKSCVLLALLLVLSLLLLSSREHVRSEEQSQQTSTTEPNGERTEKDGPSTVTLQRQTEAVCQSSVAKEGDNGEENNDGEENDMSELEHSNSRLWGTITNHAPSCQYLNNIGYLSADYWIQASKESAPRKHFCDLNHFCDGLAGGWTRIANLNMTKPNSKCPRNWQEITTPRRTCGRKQERGGHNGAGCSAAIFSPPPGLRYNHVCGRIVGYQYCNTMAFWSYFHGRSTSINDPFLDGVTISRLSDSYSTEREHVWSFVSSLHPRYYGVDAVCSCTNNNGQKKAAPPPWVDKHYFCETGVTGEQAPPNSGRDCVTKQAFYTANKLWDGAGCNSNSTCCEHNGPPWFCRKLQGRSDRPLEVRICGNGYVTFVNTPIEMMELYVQ